MPWDRELAHLEQAITHLNADYDAFLYGTVPKAPVDLRRETETAFRRLTTGDPDSAADAFRLATLQTRYSALCERWDRLQLEKEAGRRPGIYSRFKGSHPEKGSPQKPNAAASPSVDTSGGGSAPKKSSVPGADRDLFEKYLEAKKNKGEDVSGYEFHRFAESLSAEREKIRERLGHADVEFVVTERDGRIKLVARRKGE